MFYRTLLLLTAFSCLCQSCKKGDNVNLNNDDQEPVDYMSTKPGSWWLYTTTDNDVYKRVATGTDSFKAGLLYDYYQRIDTNGQYVTPEYFGKNSDKYLMLFDLDGHEENYITVVISKDSIQQGNTWTNTGTFTISGINVDAKTESEVLATGLTLNINGKTYNNVVQIKNDLKAKPHNTPIYVNCGNATLWFCHGVGLVKESYDIHVMGFYSKQYTDSLIDYHVEP